MHGMVSMYEPFSRDASHRFRDDCDFTAEKVCVPPPVLDVLGLVGPLARRTDTPLPIDLLGPVIQHLNTLTCPRALLVDRWPMYVAGLTFICIDTGKHVWSVAPLR